MHLRSALCVAMVNLVALAASAQRSGTGSSAQAFAQSSGASVQTQVRPPDLLTYSITGSWQSKSPAENAAFAMMHPEVQRLLLDVAAAPRASGYIESKLSGSGVSLADMVSNGSLKLEDGRYRLNFSLLTRADQETIRRATAEYSQTLASAILKRRAEIEALLRSYDGDGVDRRQVAFFVLGCMSLDWDGLALATEKGYRAAEPKRRGGQFFVMAEETGGVSLRQIYWGSNDATYDTYAITTFGDHFSRRVELGDLKHSASASMGAMTDEEFGKSVGALMVALRDGPQTAASLAKRAGTETKTAVALLKVLEQARWVAVQGDTYRAQIPVLSVRDRELVFGLRRIGREVMSLWLAENYEPFRAAVKHITPLRNGVPYPQTFDQLWHYLFGTANQRLVEAGLFADPYATGNPHPGYVPAVWETRVW